MRKVYHRLATPESSGLRIGFFRGICGVVGGLLVSYLGLTVLACLLPGSLGESLILPILLFTLTWPCAGLWIVLSPTRLAALSRSIVPTLVFSLLIFIL